MEKSQHIHPPSWIAPWAVLAVLFSLFALPACSIYETDDWNRGQFGDGATPDQVVGQRPVYGREDAYEIYSDVTRRIEAATSVFTDGDLLFTVDSDRGVHISDNATPSAPRQLTFIRVLGIRTASAADGFLYVNNFEDFVTIDISDLDNVRVIDRQEGFYEAAPAFPAGGYRGFFECYDPARGPLNGWEEATINEPQCRI